MVSGTLYTAFIVVILLLVISFYHLLFFHSVQLHQNSTYAGRNEKDVSLQSRWSVCPLLLTPGDVQIPQV